MQFTFEYSPLWLLLAAPLALAAVWWLYWHRSQYQDWKPAFKAMLGAFRWIVMVVLAFLLLQPLLISNKNDEERPKLIVMQDVSQSVATNEQQALIDLIKANEPELEMKYDIEYLAMGERIRDYSDTATDVSLFTNYQQMLDDLSDRYYNQNIGAVVLATDGVTTLGIDPRFGEQAFSAPLFCLALGDSTIQPDIEISELLNNKLVFLGNEFEIKARVRLQKVTNKKIEIKLVRGGAVLQTIAFETNKKSEVKEFIFRTKADRVGMNRYSIVATVLDEEPNKLNNISETFIEVLDNRTRILMLAKSPHPDIAAIRQAIEASEQYEVEVKLINEWDGKTDRVDMAILHGLPGDAQDLNKIKEFRSKEIPVLSILTTGVSLLHFKSMDLGLDIIAGRMQSDESGAEINAGFNLFKVPAENGLNRYPPLKVIFGDYVPTGEYQTMLTQRIGAISIDKPLLSFSSKQGWKRAVLAGEGWWQWRLFAAMQQDSKWPDELMLKTVQYLALKQKRNRLNIAGPRQLAEGKPAIFEGEFYNESFELTNDAALNLILTDSSGEQLDYRFLNDGLGYKLNTGAQAPGTYEWKAELQYNGEVFAERGEFTVSKNNAEFVNLIANYPFLEQWSAKSGGKTFNRGDEVALVDTLNQLDTAKTIIHTTRDWQSLISWKWLCFLLALLAASEWLLRKLNGYY